MKATMWASLFHICIYVATEISKGLKCYIFKTEHLTWINFLPAKLYNLRLKHQAWPWKYSFTFRLMAAAWCLHSERRIIKGNSSLENFEDFICGGVLGALFERNEPGPRRMALARWNCSRAVLNVNVLALTANGCSANTHDGDTKTKFGE